MLLRIKSVYLENFGAYEGGRTFDLANAGSGIIGIFGPNGRGKSTFIDSIRFALKGSLDESLYTYVHGWGKKSSIAKVTVVFETDDGDMEIKRSIKISDKLTDEEIDTCLREGVVIKSSVRSSMKLGDMSLKSTTEVNDKIAELTGLTKQQETAVFVLQNRAGEIFHARPSARKDMIAQFCGSDVCAKAVDAAQAKDRQLPTVDRTQEYVDKKEQYESGRARFDEIDKLIKDKEAELVCLPTVDDCSGTIQAYEAAAANADKISSATAKLDKANEALSDRGHKINALQMELKLLKEEHTAAYEAYTAALSASEVAKAAETARKHKEALQSDLQAAVAEREQAEATKRGAQVPQYEKGAYDKVIKDLDEKLRDANKFIEAFASDGKCPTCGTELQDEQMLEQNRNLVAELTPQLESYMSGKSMLDAAWSEFEKTIDWYNSVVPGMDARIAKLNNELQSTPDPVVVDSASAQSVIDEYRKRETKISTVEADLSEHQRHYHAAELDKSEAESTLAAVSSGDSPSKEAYDKAVEDKKVVAEINHDIATLRGEQTGINTTLTVTYAELEKLAGLVAAEELTMQAKQFLGAVKAAMHRDAIPRDLAQTYISEINDKTQLYCQHLHTPFSLFLEPSSFEFMAALPDVSVPVSQLSGGQKTMAAWAWHLALYEQHAGGLGFMFLDEPTVGLDAANMSNVTEVLSTMNDYCVSNGVQLFVISHESSLAKYFTHDIRL